MAYNDLYTMTPGSAVADTIQTVLQRRREESRQAMLDKLQEERVRAEMANEQRRLAQGDEQIGLERQRTQSAIAQNEAQIAESKERTFGEKVKTLPRAGGNLDQIGDPGLRDELVRRGMTQQVSPEGPTEAGGTLQPYGRFLGSPEYQKEQDELERYRALPDRPGVQDLLGAGITPPAQMLLPDNPLITISPSGVPTTHEGVRIPGGQQNAFELNHPPQLPSAYITSQSMILPNPSDGGKPWVAWIKPGDSVDKAVFISPYSEGMGKFGSPDANRPDIGGNTNRIQQAAQQLRTAVQGTGGNRDEAIAVARAALLSANPNMSPQAKQALDSIASSFSRATRPPTIEMMPSAIDMVTQKYSLTPKDVQEINEILRIYFSGPEIQ